MVIASYSLQQMDPSNTQYRGNSPQSLTLGTGGTLQGRNHLVRGKETMKWKMTGEVSMIGLPGVMYPCE